RGAAARQEQRTAGVLASADRAVAVVLLPTSPQPPSNGGTQPPTGEPPNPYKGLRAFQEVDAPDFFGREALVGRLCARFGEEGELSRFLAVVGASGAGKSSLVRAGLIPMLRRGALPGGANPLVVNVIPGAKTPEQVEQNAAASRRPLLSE